MVGRRGRRSAGSGVQLTFEVIAEALRERIRSGGLRPGDPLPTQAVLMREFGASSLTVQKAMTLLKQEGWAVSRPGKGAFVAHRDHPDGADDLDGPEVTASAGGRRPVSRRWNWRWPRLLSRSPTSVTASRRWSRAAASRVADPLCRAR
ncbi:GntR family transcriptional regulator [Streptomyces chiangmaiensis]